MPPTTTTMKRAATPDVGGVEVTEVPIFLQKAYHMIDTCDPDICCWSEDGLTFIVKNTVLFETTIIPQFFKHNKFSSFVRQLNFYGFRKVKFSNSLRIDRELEAETAKFWRFRHDSFRRGREDLLTEIRRMPSASSSSLSSSSSSSSSSTSTSTSAVPSIPAAAVGDAAVVASPPPVLSSSSVARPTTTTATTTASDADDGSRLENEMMELRQRVAFMSKSIDELADLVRNVSVKEGGGGPSSVVSPGGGAARVEPEGLGKKRRMCENAAAAAATIEEGEEGEEDSIMETGGFMPDWAPSSSEFAGMDEDSLEFSGMMCLPDLAPSSSSSSSSSSSASPSPASGDDDFVDDLFQAFAGEDSAIELTNNLAAERAEDKNVPDPQLMKRIEESLSTIPREMHEMVASRLIDAISNARPIAESASSLFPSRQCPEEVKADRSISVDEGDAAVADEALVTSACPATTVAPSSIPLPLAVATLKTILAEYGVSVECTRRASCKDAYTAVAGRRMFAKSLPVVPMHA